MVWHLLHSDATWDCVPTVPASALELLRFDRFIDVLGKVCTRETLCHMLPVPCATKPHSPPIFCHKFSMIGLKTE